jgi:hypothetical protein
MKLQLVRRLLWEAACVFNHGQDALSMDMGVYIPVTDGFFMLYAVVTWIVGTGRILLYRSVLNSCEVWSKLMYSVRWIVFVDVR